MANDLIRNHIFNPWFNLTEFHNNFDLFVTKYCYYKPDYTDEKAGTKLWGWSV